MIQEKIQLMSRLYECGFKVFVDYSDDILNISEAFMTENNVRFTV